MTMSEIGPAEGQAPADQDTLSESEYNATVAQRTEIAPGLIILRVVPDRLPFPFRAGQYVVLGLKGSEPRVALSDDDPESAGIGAERDGLIRRAYSIASSSRGDEFLEFYLTLVRSGELSPRLFQLGVGGRLRVGTGAAGVFTLDKAPRDRHVLLAATGTGLAPYMSMLRTDLACGGWRRFVILHGARYSWDLGYRTELMALRRLCSNLTYIPVISRPAEDLTWRGRSGYLQDVLISSAVRAESGLYLTPETFHVYLCGNPAMIEAATARLIERGFVKDTPGEIGTIHAEEYWQAGPTDGAPGP
jgi:ferredoxin/flavodoxin---NADP+ reductase